jgi:hypothetical protein
VSAETGAEAKCSALGEDNARAKDTSYLPDTAAFRSLRVGDMTLEARLLMRLSDVEQKQLVGMLQKLLQGLENVPASQQEPTCARRPAITRRSGR